VSFHQIFVFVRPDTFSLKPLTNAQDFHVAARVVDRVSFLSAEGPAKA